MESKRERRYLHDLTDNGAHAWTPYNADASTKARSNHPIPMISRIARQMHPCGAQIFGDDGGHDIGVLAGKSAVFLGF